jgi:hypothetical protein
MAKLPTKPKLCFVVGPIGADDSDDRIHADWLLEAIIRPVFEEHFEAFRVERADKISDPGRIDAQVITALLNADLVVADLTTLNPNAFYEIGIRHTIQKPIIHMRLENQPIPFDVASFRTISFSRKRPSDLEISRELLRSAVSAAIADDHVVDNPVTFSRGKVEFEQTATAPEKIIQDQLSDILRRLGTIENGGVPMQFLLGNPPQLRESRNFLVHAGTQSENALRDIGKIRIEIMPLGILGIGTFTNDIERLVGNYLTEFSISGDSSTAVVSAKDTEFNRNGAKALLEAVKSEGMVGRLS